MARELLDLGASAEEAGALLCWKRFARSAASLLKLCASSVLAEDVCASGAGAGACGSEEGGGLLFRAAAPGFVLWTLRYGHFLMPSLRHALFIAVAEMPSLPAASYRGSEKSCTTRIVRRRARASVAVFFFRHAKEQGTRKRKGKRQERVTLVNVASLRTT
eukprot:1561540-Rhodomonas_salina.1